MDLKDSINKRFINSVNRVINDGLAKNKRQIASDLGMSPSKFSEILNNRMNVGLDTIQIFCNTYNVNYYYIFEEKGDFYVRVDVGVNVGVGHQNVPLDVPLQQKNSKNSVCISCKDKERTINALQLAIESLNTQVEDLRQDKSRLTALNEKLQAQIDEKQDSRKQRSA